MKCNYHAESLTKKQPPMATGCAKEMMRPSARPNSPPLAHAPSGRKVAAVAAAATMAAVSREGCLTGLKLVRVLASRAAKPIGSKLGRRPLVVATTAAKRNQRIVVVSE